MRLDTHLTRIKQVQNLLSQIIKKIKRNKNYFKNIEKNQNSISNRLYFEHLCIIKWKKYKYLNADNFVTIYSNEFTHLFPIVDSNKNHLLDCSISTEVK